MKEAAIRKKLRELYDVITALPSPGGPKKGLHGGIYYPKTSPEIEPIEDSLDQLRLQVKYLMFDLEATRRENRYLRQMLENRHRPKSDDSKDGLGDF